MCDRSNLDNFWIAIMILFLLLGFTLIGVMAYLGIKGTNEIIDYHNKRGPK